MNRYILARTNINPLFSPKLVEDSEQRLILRQNSYIEFRHFEEGRPNAKSSSDLKSLKHGKNRNKPKLKAWVFYDSNIL